MCYIGSAAVTYLTSMTGGARPKIARRPSPGRRCAWSRPHAGAVARRDASGKAIKALFIASCFRTLIRLPEALLPPLQLLLSLSRRKTSYLRQKVAAVRLYCVFPADCSAASLVWPPRRPRVAAHFNRELGGEMKKEKKKTQTNKKETQGIIHFKSAKLPAVTRWTVY